MTAFNLAFLLALVMAVVAFASPAADAEANPTPVLIDPIYPLPTVTRYPCGFKCTARICPMYCLPVLEPVLATRDIAPRIIGPIITDPIITLTPTTVTTPLPTKTVWPCGFPCTARYCPMMCRLPTLTLDARAVATPITTHKCPTCPKGKICPMYMCVPITTLPSITLPPTTTTTVTPLPTYTTMPCPPCYPNPKLGIMCLDIACIAEVTAV